MALLNREAFFQAAPKLKSEDVSALGGTVRVSELTAGERDKFEETHLKAKRANFRARLVAWCVRDGEGGRMFQDCDIPAIAALPASTIESVAEAATRVNALSSAEVDDLEGN